MKRNVILFSCLGLLLVLLAAVNLLVGSMNAAVFAAQPSAAAAAILWRIRLPRLVEAAVLGGALALSGYLLQCFFANPIAGPFVLGISSGAKLVVAFVMVAAMSGGFVLHSWMMVCAAFAGALIATGFVLVVSARVRSMSVLVVCGVMLGYICSAATELLVTFADDSNIVNLHNWSQGSFSAASWAGAGCYIPIVIVASLAALFLSKPLEAFMMGENYARSLGIPIRRFRTALILISSVLSAVVTAFAGPVSFVGIAVPHVVRQLFRSNRPLVVIPACLLAGADFCLFADLLARRLYAPTELNISTITAVFGAPIVIRMMLQARKER